MASPSTNKPDGNEAKRAEMTWIERLKIIPSVAEGLLYVHVGSGKTIIHRDLKPANILLADDWTPKIADFGLAKHVTDPAALHTPFGPYGYSAPERWRGETTNKSDVYSFGVMLLEIVSGRQNRVMQRLLPHAWNSWNSKGCSLQELLDPKVPPPQNARLLSRLQRFVHIGLLCVQELPVKRPSISQVVEMLRSDGPLPPPERPTLREGETSITIHTTDGEQGETSNTMNADDDGIELV